MSSVGRRIVALPAGRKARWLVLVGWLIALVVAVPLGGKLSSVTADSDTVELPRGAEGTQVEQLANRFPDSQVTPAILVYVRDGGLTAADRAKVAADRTALGRLADGSVDEPVVSTDGKATILLVPLKDDSTLADQAEKVREQGRSGAPAQLKVKLTGPAGNALDARDANERTNKLITLVTLLVITVLLLAIYRSPFLWLLPLITVGVAFTLVRAVEYIFARTVDMTVDSGNTAVLTVLIFGVGTDYALLLLARYRDELRQHDSRWEAMANALRSAVPAIIASAATVSLGLLTLLVAKMGFNYTLGSAGAVAIICTLVATITLLPALLVTLGRWVFWPLVPRPRDKAARHTTLWQRIGNGVSRRPRLIWIGTALVLGALALGINGMQIGLKTEDQISGTPESVAGQQLLAAHFPAGRSQPVNVVVNAATADQVRAAIQGVPGVANVADAVRSTDGKLVRIDAVLSDPVDSAAAEATVDRIRAATHVQPGTDAKVGGATAEQMERGDAQAHDRKAVIPLVLGVVFLVLLLLLRSLVAPVLLLLTVILSYSAALGASWLFFDRVFNFAAADDQLILVGFLFLVALGVDYNIFLVSRIREEAGKHDHRTGVVRGLVTTGGVITSAGVVLAATFAALTLAPQVAFKEIGFLIALGVLLDTLLVRSLLVPALGLDVGQAFWWPGRLSRRRFADPPDRTVMPSSGRADVAS
jgi:RND superfamily putative drug exporter